MHKNWAFLLVGSENECGSWAYYACGSSDDGDSRKSSEEEGGGLEAQLRKRSGVELTAERGRMCVDIKGERGRSVSGTGFTVWTSKIPHGSQKAKIFFVLFYFIGYFDLLLFLFLTHEDGNDIHWICAMNFWFLSTICHVMLSSCQSDWLWSWYKYKTVYFSL